MAIALVRHTEMVEHLFAGWEETLIWSCLQGVMGKIYAAEGKEIRAAMALLGDFCFLAGEPDRELAGFKPEGLLQDFIIMVPQNEAWERVIREQYGERARRVERYAFKKEGAGFDREKLLGFVSALPPEYELTALDEGLYHWCKKQEWCRDWVSQFPDYDSYERYGLGVVIQKDKSPVAGASSYSAYREGIEIEIDTREEYRRRGLATISGAALILRCLDRGLYPSWDAQNPWSAALAKKLGYRFDFRYPAYEIRGF